MKYIQQVKTDAEVVASEEYDILYHVTGNDKVYLKPIQPKYFVELSANGEGNIYINPGYINADGISASVKGTSFSLAYTSSDNKSIDGVTYYAYKSAAVGEYYSTIDVSSMAKGEVVNTHVYMYDDDDNEMKDLFGTAIDVTVIKYDSSYTGPAEETLTYSSGNDQKIAAHSEIISVYGGINGDGFRKTDSTLTSIIIPDGITTIGENAFERHEALESVKIPDTVTTIEDGAFEEDKKLSSITMNKVISIGEDVFYDTAIENLDFLPETVKYIGGYTFGYCQNLTSATFSNNVESIGEYCFYECYSLTSVILPNGITSIGESMFYDCRKLASITIPEGVTSIGERAFSMCSSFTSITIPEGVTSIGNSAFNQCENLTSVVYKGVEYTTKTELIAALSGVTLGEDVFANTKLGE